MHHSKWNENDQRGSQRLYLRYLHICVWWLILLALYKVIQLVFMPRLRVFVVN